LAYKILVVDDEKDIVEAIKNRLQREDYEVAVAYDGEEALLQIKAINPDLLLLDLRMPKLNGFEVLKIVREKFTDKWRPVIIISASNDLKSVKDCYAMEADHYLIKPCSVEDISKGVRIMLSLIPLRIK